MNAKTNVAIKSPAPSKKRDQNHQIKDLTSVDAATSAVARARALVTDAFMTEEIRRLVPPSIMNAMLRSRLSQNVLW